MIENTFNDNFSQEWIAKNITDPNNELVILREIIPWEKIVKELSQFYNKIKGCYGKPIRVVVAVLIKAHVAFQGLLKRICSNYLDLFQIWQGLAICEIGLIINNFKIL